MTEPVWLPVEAVIGYNQMAVEATGERHLIQDWGKLESALWRPWNVWAYENDKDIVSLAAVLLHGIAKAHAFEQGNKRAALASCVAFLEANGFAFTAPDDSATAAHVIMVVTGLAGVRDSYYWLKQWTKEQSEPPREASP